jgi:hypothetical protein
MYHNQGVTLTPLPLLVRVFLDNELKKILYCLSCISHLRLQYPRVVIVFIPFPFHQKLFTPTYNTNIQDPLNLKLRTLIHKQLLFPLNISKRKTQISPCTVGHPCYAFLGFFEGLLY